MSMRTDKWKNREDWDKEWEQIFDRYQQDLRHAHYIRAVLEQADRRVLELAAGSFRDMALLNRLGVDCEGMDFSETSTQKARERFPEIASKIHAADAFALPFKDKQFDVSYHNGFWVLFEDEPIHRLVQEQARISRRAIIATVHNAHNAQFKAYFERMARTDPLYAIRFLDSAFMSEVMRPLCRSVRIIPVGKAKKRHEDLLIRYGLAHPRLMRFWFDRFASRHIDSAERLMCVGVL